MGYDLNRFHTNVDEELICSICSSVLEDPVQAPDCEHAFCELCISQWLNQQQSCPIDRKPITTQSLKPVPRILRNLLSKLLVSCDNASYGCSTIVKLESLALHIIDCPFNPKKPVECTQGCSMIVPKDELHTHSCVRELRKVINEQNSKIEDLTCELLKQKNEINVLTNEMKILKECIRILKPNNPTVRSYMDHVDSEEIVRWTSSLPVARVTRWGGMISTPDAVLQAVIKRALTECTCPPHIINDLMENAHERHWPPGLCTLENRQLNRRHYDSFVCRRIPSKQAVVVMACDNRHMESHLISKKKS
jgi:E3 ubiquitin-protein ligase NRDP1